MDDSLPFLLSLSVILVALPSLQVCKAQSEKPSLPSFPNYFSAYTETIQRINDSNSTVVLSRTFYDTDRNFARFDYASAQFDPSSSGLLTVIQDINTELMYSINTDSSNCTVSPLIPSAEVFVGEDGRYHLLSVNDFFTSAVNLSYGGNMSAHGIILDNWEYKGNLNRLGFNYTNASIQLSITRAGQSIATLSSVTDSPLPWRLSVQTTVSGDSVPPFNLSAVVRYFDLSFEEPGTDVFDISLCAMPQDALYLTLAMLGTVSGINLSQLRGNTRKAVADYTNLYPTQVGNIQITSENGTFLFASLQISNLSSEANVSNRKTAQEAYDEIIGNTVDGQLPFQIQISSDDTVTPYLITPQKCSTSTVTVTPSRTEPTETPSPSLVIITTTTTVTETPTVSCSLDPIPTPSTTCPPNTATGVAQGHVVGIAFGTLITGAFLSCIVIITCFVCYQKTRTKMWSPGGTDGYQKTPDSMADREYFQ